MDILKKALCCMPIAAMLFMIQSCSKVEPREVIYEEQERTILVYMASKNTLQSNAVQNIRSIMGGYLPEKDNLVLYCDNFDINSGRRRNEGTSLVRLSRGEKGVKVDTLYRFPIQNSANKQALASALKVTATLLPAKHYGLILWSHGTGWLPEGYYSSHPVASRSFAEEDGSEMSITDLAQALEMPFKMDFIAFDACLMGGIEVAYQLKDVCDHLLFSPAEILSYGFPYKDIIKPLFEDNYEEAAKVMYDSYATLSNPSDRSVTVSLVKTSELEEVAAVAKDIFAQSREAIATLNKNNVQRYYRGQKRWFYDLQDYIDNICPSSSSQMQQALSKAVIAKYTTGRMLELYINPAKFSGLSTYIPYEDETELAEYYKTLAWNKAVNMIE